jgi:phage tail-like protein
VSEDRLFPYVAFKFLVEFNGSVVASFAECSGLQAETEFDEVYEGGVNDHRFKLPKGSKYGNVTLRRGLTDSEVLWSWHRDVVGGQFQRKTVAVIVWDEETRDQAWRWEFAGAYPVKWIGPDLKADGSAVAIETLELAHHGISDFQTK